MAEQLLVLDLEKALAEDSEGRRRDEVVSVLASKALETKALIDKGVPPAEYETLCLHLEALQAASRVVQRVWYYHHRN